MKNKDAFFGKKFRVLISALLFPVCLFGNLWASSAFDPLEYPFGEIGNPHTPFVWQDLYNERDLRYRAKYRITVKKKEEGSKSESFNLTPRTYMASFYIAGLPLALAPGSYSYTIERLVDGISVDSRYYHYRRYPITGEFVLNPASLHDFEKLSNEKLVDYLVLERKNKRENGYHALFFAGSGTFTLAAGYAVYRYTNFGIISTVIAAVCVLSSAVGYSAGGYYGYRYYEGRAELDKMLLKHEKEQMNKTLHDKTAWFSVGRSL